MTTNVRWHEPVRPSALLLMIPLLAPITAMILVLRDANMKKIVWSPVLTTGGITLMISLIIITIVALLIRQRGATAPALKKRLMASPGWPRNAPKASHLDARSTRKQIKHTFPLRPRAALNEAAVVLGTDRKGAKVYLPVDGSLLVVGPSGSGKDRRVAIPILEQWPGAAVVTSTKVDLAAASWEARIKYGPIAVFAPSGMQIEGAMVSWNPILGCQNPEVASRRASALVAGGFAGGGENAFWGDFSALIIRGCLHAAALADLNILDAARMASSTAGWSNAANLIERDGGAHHFITELQSSAAGDPRTTSSALSVISTVLGGLAYPTLAKALDGTSGTQTDLGDLLAAGGTMYVVAPTEGDRGAVYRPWTCLLVSEASAILREASGGGRLDRPALLLLNEIANVAPIPELPGLLADGRGHNICTIPIVQDPAQLRVRYGQDAAVAITAAAQHHLLLSAGSHETARDWESLIGNHRRKNQSRTHKPGSLVASSQQQSLDDHPILPAQELHHLPYGIGILLPRGGRAFPLHLLGPER